MSITIGHPSLTTIYGLTLYDQPMMFATNPKTNKSPIELFSSVNIAPNARHVHTFGCPVYMLDKDMQAGRKISKWQLRSRVGAYLGPSGLIPDQLDLF